MATTLFNIFLLNMSSHWLQFKFVTKFFLRKKKFNFFLKKTYDTPNKHVCMTFFLLPAYVDFGGQKLLFCTVVILFIYCSNTIHTLKNIKNGSHGTFHTFKNYFATVFSVFSFQFSVFSLLQCAFL